jgi:hypothetical protein
MKSPRQRLEAMHWAEFKHVVAKAKRGGDMTTAEITELRYTLYERALGKPPKGREHWSLSDLKGAKFDQVITEFRVQSGRADLNDGFKANNAARIVLLHSIANLGLTESYINAIARDKFQNRNWPQLTDHELTQLRMNCRRAANRQKSLAPRAATPELLAEAIRLKTGPNLAHIA